MKSEFEIEFTYFQVKGNKMNGTLATQIQKQSLGLTVKNVFNGLSVLAGISPMLAFDKGWRSLYS